ncbi:MAG: exosortase/archaeosortase family protein [Deltaproteobacteria bacterium]|nr:exosortase/archaeosortase family protein [Deltaproteobacteria bacterium]
MATRPRPAAPPPPTGESRPPTFAGFVVRLLLYLFLASLAFSLGEMHLRMRPLQVAMATTVTAGANLLGAGAEVEETVIKTKHAALDINHECTAVFVLLVYAMFVLAYPAPWVQRLSGIAIGFTVLMAINLARLVVLTLIASNYPDWFAYFHEYFFQGLFIALLAFLASLWTEQVRRATVGRLST